MSDAMQSVVFTEKLGEERMGTSELKSLLKIDCAVPRSRWRVWMDTQGYMGGSGFEHQQSPRTRTLAPLRSRLGWYDQCSWVGGNSFLSLYTEVKKGGKRSNFSISSTS